MSKVIQNTDFTIAKNFIKKHQNTINTMITKRLKNSIMDYSDFISEAYLVIINCKGQPDQFILNTIKKKFIELTEKKHVSNIDYINETMVIPQQFIQSRSKEIKKIIKENFDILSPREKDIWSVIINNDMDFSKESIKQLKIIIAAKQLRNDTPSTSYIYYNIKLSIKRIIKKYPKFGNRNVRKSSCLTSL